ncbi:hypothetical protein NDU88_001138 [Pleurodeles waltl]|uniref:Uncharacterized protein n=1 Tax=Pleurodeles waltl TaxID=8319 RepID=A0AAV7M065_PLEWA|nr:hypothetical protein NDU88_001138 [Pleurodeles waltl]
MRPPLRAGTYHMSLHGWGVQGPAAGGMRQSSAAHVLPITVAIIEAPDGDSENTCIVQCYKHMRMRKARTVLRLDDCAEQQEETWAVKEEVPGWSRGFMNVFTGIQRHSRRRALTTGGVFYRRLERT